MPRLCPSTGSGHGELVEPCSESSRPYPGRSAQRGDVSCCWIIYQSGHWYIKPGHIELLSIDMSEIDSMKTARP